jgi:L-2-hydroxyglutarate oxidase LhgO
MADASTHYQRYDFLIIGAGVIGVSIARELRRRFGGRVLVIDKESRAGLHASGRNSGVLHAGVYYKAHTLKARLCVEGNRRMKAYCFEKQLPMNSQGKVIVTRNASELESLHELHQRSEANGVRTEIVSSDTLRDIEPCAKTVDQALFVKDTAVVNPQKVMEAFVSDSKREGVEFAFDCAWRGFSGSSVIHTTRENFSYGHLVNCAGLFADKVAKAMGVGSQFKILPFRGNYYRLSPNSKVTVRGNIYPVPDLRNPFLGVHFTTRPNGEVTVGPSALPLLGREQYQGFDGIRLHDAWNMASYLARLFRKNVDHFRSIAWKEIIKLRRSGFFQEANTLATGLKIQDLLPGTQAGIRAQMVNVDTAELMHDFVVENGPRSTHVLNAVSPAFTCSLPFAEYVVDSFANTL